MVIAAASVALAASYTVKAAQAGQAPDPITALSATVTPRVQLTLARLNIEEQRIAQLAAQLDQIRRELSAASLEAQKLSDLLPEIEKGLQTAPDDKTRRGHENQQTEVKRQLSAQGRLQEQLRTRENEAAQVLSTEQGRWVDLNARLDELERQLAPVPR
jgi:chromosome segregation ATPase